MHNYDEYSLMDDETKRSVLTNILQNTVFKELRGGDLVLSRPDGTEVVVTSEYDPWLSFYIEGQVKRLNFDVHTG